MFNKIMTLKWVVLKYIKISLLSIQPDVFMLLQIYHQIKIQVHWYFRKCQNEIEKEIYT